MFWQYAKQKEPSIMALLKFLKSHFLLLIASLFLAVSTNASLPDPQKQIFDTKSASKQFDEISIRLSTQELKLQSLSDAVVQLQSLKDQAQVCVGKAQDSINSIEEKIKKAPVTDVQKPDSILSTGKKKILRQDVKFLQEKREQYLNQASQCRLFVLRSEEAINAYQETIDSLKATKLLQRGTPIWHLFYISTYKGIQDLTWDEILQPTRFDRFQGIALVLLIGIVVITAAIAVLFQRRLRKIIRKIPKKHHILLSVIETFSRYIVQILILMAISWYTFFVFIEYEGLRVGAQIVYLLLSYYVVLAIIRMLLFPPKSARPIVVLPKKRGEKLYRCSRSLLRYFLVVALVILVFNWEDLPLEFTESIRSLSISILIIFLSCWFWKLVNATLSATAWLQYFIKGLIVAVSFGLVSIEWAGYHQLAMFGMIHVVISTLLIALIMLAHKLIHFLMYRMENVKIAQHNLKYYLGLTNKDKVKEGLLIFFITYAIAICYLVIKLMDFWGVPNNFTEALTQSLIDGFSVAGLKIVPFNISLALIVFALIVLVGRIYSTHIIHQTTYKKERTAQVTFASIVTYISFAVATLISLIVLKVDFTALAIIAGALSIGIGLGLQSIVNNFVSGLILLIEKPIRPGDRIVVNNTEGFVKKIGFRSTQVTTLERSDMIIPNADMITSPVTNYMLQDKLWRIKCSIGVAYGSDIELTMNVLFNIAQNNPRILQEKPNEPQIIFREHGESSLAFELWCVLSDVDQKFKAMTELNIAINAAFKENDIEISFPQHDIHIKDFPINYAPTPPPPSSSQSV